MSALIRDDNWLPLLPLSHECQVSTNQRQDQPGPGQSEASHIGDTWAGVRRRVTTLIMPFIGSWTGRKSS